MGSSVVEDEEQGEVDPKVALPSSGLMDSTTHHQLAASYSFSEFNSNPNSSSLSSPSPVHPLCTSLHGRQELHHGKQQQHQQQRWYTRLVLSTATVVVQANDRCAGVNPQFQPHVRLARRLMLAIVLLYWALVFHVHVFAIEPREHYQLVNRIPEPRCQCTGDVSLSLSLWMLSLHLSLSLSLSFSLSLSLPPSPSLSLDLLLSLF